VNEIIPLPAPSPVEFLRETKKILKVVVSTGNFDQGFDWINLVNEMGEAFEKSKSIMLDGMDRAWKPEKHEGETFLQAAVRKTGFSPETITRHMKNRSLLNGGAIPDEYKKIIELAPENCQVQIANLIEDGFEPTGKDWQAISEYARDRRMLGKVVRKIRKVEPRTNWSMFTMDENGNIVRHSKDLHEHIGSLDIFSDSEFVLAGIEKMKRLADIKPSVEY
jgi:hypothetical protein